MPKTFVGASLLALGLGFVGASPAFADVKAGVDAWTAGDYARAVKEWDALAAAGDPDAQFNLAQAYRLGRGVPEDLQQAELLYAKAAARGHMRAADVYGLMLFQDGRRAQAMPYIEGAANRGDPRAQYLLGIAHFNGDLLPKDWRRAYALVTLANGAGLPQAGPALAQMDEYIPLEDRQAAQGLAASLRAQAQATRQRELATLDLDAVGEGSPEPVATGNSGGANAGAERAGADYTVAARPAAATPPPVRVVPTAPAVVAAKPAAKPAVATTGGPWKVQLGAFGVPENADRMWGTASRVPAFRGATKIARPSGRVTVVLAGGFASQADAAKACSALKAAGHDCMVTR